MPATFTLLCGPAGTGKTTTLLERFRSCARTSPGAPLWLAPAADALDALRVRLAEDTAGLFGFRLHTFDEFLDEVLGSNDSRLCFLPSGQRRLLLEGLTAELRERGELPHFDRVAETHGFQEKMLGLIEELKRQQVTPAQLALAAYRRGYEGDYPGRRLHGRAISRKERECARVYARYQRALRTLHLYDEQDRAAVAADLLRRGLRCPFAGVRAVFVAGFTDFTPGHLRVLEALAEWVEELWVTLPDEPGDERAELFSRPRDVVRRLETLRPCVRAVGRGEVGARPAARAAFGPLFAQLDERPAGLRHLERQLFRPVRAVEVAEDAEGVSFIEAPGPLGEARLVARRVKTLLLEGVPADDVLVTMRDLGPSADLLSEVFAEYGVPVDVEGCEPLIRRAAVGVLLRALRLPEDDWPFAGVTALLRNTYFRPCWAELNGCPEMPQHAEALLRLLGEPRGGEAYLAAVERWAERQQPGLEDEQAEESRRRRTHELAQTCGPFLRRFFEAWDGAPGRALLAEHVAWVQRFARDLGVESAAMEDSADRGALACLWDEMGRWQAREGGTLERRTFQRRLTAMASAVGLPRSAAGPDRVRVRSAPSAQYIEAGHVFVLGLGERGFPRLGGTPTLLDESERQQLRAGGLELPGAAGQLADEMLLFYRVMTRARRQLLLSYPAVDERGQELLPGSFLMAVHECFRPGAVPVERRRMLIEGYDRDVPLSAAEYRVRVARSFAACGFALPDGDLWANLTDAANLAQRRFRDREFSPYDGMFRDANVIAEVGRLFGPERVFSPTALEDYVACPFRFFLRHVLYLEPMEEPAEEIELTRRGQAFHRALARLHRKLREAGVDQPGAEVEAAVLREVAAAVEEDVRRAPSPASQELWRLEGQRLLRLAGRYGRHWQKFVEPWRERGVLPRPSLFEVEFGPAAESEQANGPLVIRDGDVEVRVSGRIDRVDTSELEGGVGFWVVDYKTGRSGHYTSPDLAQFRRLQLTLYALATEEVLLAGQNARPLGLAYWLVNESGPKVALPARNQTLWLEELGRWRAVREQLQAWVLTLAGHIRRGAFALRPRSEDCCLACDFSQVCRIAQARSVDRNWSLPLPLADG
jgi:ATP-dependent helicase/DNAse subunit B